MEKQKYFRCEPTSYGSYIVKERMLYGAGKNYFKTKQEAINHFEKAEKIALNKYEKIMDGIHKLKEKVGRFSYECEATALDDSGLETQLYIEFDVNGYNFRFNQN